MSLPLSYIELVTETVKGNTPINEYKQLAFTPTTSSSFLNFLISLGGKKFVTQWKRLSPSALSMCGDKTIAHLIKSMEIIQKENIEGDFIEAGVWRGGLPILMRAFLHDTQDQKRKVYVADSFQGLPTPSHSLNDRIVDLLLKPFNSLSVSRKDVEDAFDYFGLNDNQVVFLEGWFKDTLKSIPHDNPLSLIRLDGDYYESTKDAIENLYPRLAPGGFIIIDDYNLPLGCKTAVDEYRSNHQISDKIMEINSQAVYWRKL